MCSDENKFSNLKQSEIFSEDAKSMREQVMDQAEEKYRVSSEWVDHTSVASQR